MLKLKKMLRISLVGCIAVSTLMIGAGAVVTDTAPKLAEYAGETVTCNVNIANVDGIFAQQSIDIVIPDDATEAEANALIEQSAEAVATQHIAMPRNYGSYDLYTGEGRVLNLVSSGYGSVIADVIVDDKGDYYMMGVSSVIFRPTSRQLTALLWIPRSEQPKAISLDSAQQEAAIADAKPFL